MSNVDPILLSVYARTFKSIADEMSMSIQQTARSPILCEANAGADGESSHPRILPGAGM